MTTNPALELATSLNMEANTIFYNHVKHILAAKSNEISKLQKLSEKEKAYWIDVYKNKFPKQLRNTTFLLFFGHLEETLFHSFEVKKPENVKLGRGTGLEKFKDFIKWSICCSLGEYKPYLHLRDAQYIRNSLLHVAGRVSISKDADAINSILKRNKDYYDVKHDRLEVTPQGLLQAQQAVIKLCEDVQ